MSSDPDHIILVAMIAAAIIESGVLFHASSFPPRDMLHRLGHTSSNRPGDSYDTKSILAAKSKGSAKNREQKKRKKKYWILADFEPSCIFSAAALSFLGGRRRTGSFWGRREGADRQNEHVKCRPHGTVVVLVETTTSVLDRRPETIRDQRLERK